MPYITLRPEPVLDPRGEPSVTPAPLAPRLPSLAGRRVVFYDNTKLAFAQYGAILPALGHLLEEQGARVAVVRRNLRGTEAAAMGEAVEEVRGAGAQAAVLALADMGVTPATVLLAAELERAGVPTVVLCAEPGAGLARVVARAYVPGLPLCPLALDQGTPREEVVRQVEAAFPQVVAGLTAAPAPGDVQAGEVPLPPLQPRGATVEQEGDLTFATVDPGAVGEELYEALGQASLGDGLPVVPPTRARVEAMLAWTDRKPAEGLIPRCQPSGADLTVERLAVNAVLAGCRPHYLPVLVAAFQAMSDPRFAFLQGTTTSHPAGHLVLVSGPIAAEVGLHGGAGCLGPGFRANATIGRAITLALISVARAVPGQADLSCQGSPAEYTYCCAENTIESPWAPLAEELHGPGVTTVTVHRCEGPHNVVDFLSTTPEGILEGVASVAATLGGNSAYHPSHLVVFLSVTHARLIAAAGWGKAEVRRFLYERARVPRARLQGRGLVPHWPPEFEALVEVPVVRRPEDVLVVTAGGVGPHSSVAVPWGMGEAVTVPLALADGRPARTIADFRRGV